MRKHLIAALAGLIGLSLAAQAHAAWVRTWAASPEPPTPNGGRFPGSPSFENQTLREVVRISAGGRSVRVLLTNEFGAKPLRIGAAHIAVSGPDGSIRPDTDHVLLFGGLPTATVPVGAPLLSDPIDMTVPGLSRLAISLYLPEATGPCTCHGWSDQTLYVADQGDQTGAPSIPAQTGRFAGPRAFLSGVDVDTAVAAHTVVMFGDSITDGVGATTDLNLRWPDQLADLLGADGKWGIANQGISGNRVLRDGAAQNAQARFDRDVLATPGVTAVVVFEGVNDLGRGAPPPSAGAPAFGPPEPVTAEAMMAGYRQLISRAHARGLKIYGATIAPYKGASYWSPEGEAMRETINAWILGSGAFDGVVDFDAALRDPADPAQIRAGYHFGDHLHGSDAGYKVMAQAIYRSLFAPKALGLFRSKSAEHKGAH